MPDPRRAWPRESSLVASLRAGGHLPAPGSTLLPAALPAERTTALADAFPDLRRHFIFEYYPWYAASPYRHWDQWDRVPPADLASNFVPRLGAYDSRSRAVLEQHARWIADSGAGAVNLSWWGPGSFEDEAAPLVMDTFRDHDLKVAFHLEPYADDHGRRYVDDVLYILRRFGEQRHYDAFLILQNSDGTSGPLVKSFRSLLPYEVVDCHGIRQRVSDFTTDDDWKRQTETLRRTLRNDFDHVTLLADTLDFARARAAGFDGIAIYDNFVPPASYAPAAAGASAQGLVFSFNVNPGFDTIEPRQIEPESCYKPTPFAPPAQIDWTSAEGVELAARLSEERIRESLQATLLVQTDPALANDRRGFFLVYLTSFNEWHEGHAFEPMKDRAAFTVAESVFGYHNPAQGDYRLTALSALLGQVLAPGPARHTAAA